MSANTKKTIGTVLSILAIAANTMAISTKALLGKRAGWEQLMLYIAVGFVLSIISIIVKRNTVAWAAVASSAASIALFFIQ